MATGDGRFSPAEHYFSDRETETLRRKRVYPTGHNPENFLFFSLSTFFSPVCTTNQENCQPKYLPNRFTHDRFSHMTDLRWNQEVKYFWGGGGGWSCRVRP